MGIHRVTENLSEGLPKLQDRLARKRPPKRSEHATQNRPIKIRGEMLVAHTPAVKTENTAHTRGGEGEREGERGRGTLRGEMGR